MLQDGRLTWLVTILLGRAARFCRIVRKLLNHRDTEAQRNKKRRLGRWPGKATAFRSPIPVIPAKAGIQPAPRGPLRDRDIWIPAFAGMTVLFFERRMLAGLLRPVGLFGSQCLRASGGKI